MNGNRLKSLFLSQSYKDAWMDYQRSLSNSEFECWDYIILTASNESQADSYRSQLMHRQQNGLLPSKTQYLVVPDPDGKRVGSGGATLNVLREVWKLEKTFDNKRLLVIHSGGDSKRVPQYSACGKLFSPVPRELPDGRSSTLFDEFVIGMSGVPNRIKEGMLVLSGDVLLLFNPLQIDVQQGLDAAAISMKVPVSVGKNHGVFLNGENNQVRKFLHKQPVETLKSVGAVNAHGNVNLDTGAILISVTLLNAIFSLISRTDNKEYEPDEYKFQKFVNNTVQLNFYGDFLYPLAKDATLDNFLSEQAENTRNDELLWCRKKIWEVLSKYSLQMISLSPAQFIHFGTTRELLDLVTAEIDDYSELGWSKNVLSVINTNSTDCKTYAVHRAYIGEHATIASGAYIENSFIFGQTKIGRKSIVSGLKLRDYCVPEHVVMSGLPILHNQENAIVIRIYGIDDNPKKQLFMGETLKFFLQKNHLKESDVWDGKNLSLWFARLYPVCSNMQDALKMTKILFRMVQDTATEVERKRWLSSRRTSLFESFNSANLPKIFDWEHDLENRILSKRFQQELENGSTEMVAIRALGSKGVTEGIYHELLKDISTTSIFTKIRLYHTLATVMKEHRLSFDGITGEYWEQSCFKLIRDEIVAGNTLYDTGHKPVANLAISQENVTVELPVRVNWGGGWTDTPPICHEIGGVVLNAAITLNGKKPIQASVKKLNKMQIEFASVDIGAYQTFNDLSELRSCNNPYDPFALHKAAFLVCGIIPPNDLTNPIQLSDLLQTLGGGISLSTQVVGIPKGSGLGTSSLLAAACVKALYRFMGYDVSEAHVCNCVLMMEQMMSTGGGWQDQVGGLLPGVKFITSKAGLDQSLDIKPIKMSPETRTELQERFALIYTGQRRLARNLLRDVIGSYIARNESTMNALREMRVLAALMRFQLEQGRIDEFAALLNQHWEASLQLDPETSNTCIEQIFLACADMIDARFICGAGGGGFLQVIMKKNITKDDLRHRLHAIFQDSGVDVWDSEFVWEDYE